MTLFGGKQNLENIQHTQDDNKSIVCHCQIQSNLRHS